MLEAVDVEGTVLSWSEASYEFDVDYDNADIAFLIDTTCSMGSLAQEMGREFRDIASDLSSSIPNLSFGVAEDERERVEDRPRERMVLLGFEGAEQDGAGQQHDRHQEEAELEVREGDAEEAPLRPEARPGGMPMTVDSQVFDARDGHAGVGPRNPRAS